MHPACKNTGSKNRARGYPLPLYATAQLLPLLFEGTTEQRVVVAAVVIVVVILVAGVGGVVVVVVVIVL